MMLMLVPAAIRPPMRARTGIYLRMRATLSAKIWVSISLGFWSLPSLSMAANTSMMIIPASRAIPSLFRLIVCSASSAILP